MTQKIMWEDERLNKKKIDEESKNVGYSHTLPEMSGLPWLNKVVTKDVTARSSQLHRVITHRSN
jgi:hypothetical protein